MTMFLGNIGFIVNILLLCGYFIWYPNRMVWPHNFVVWAWLPYLLHVYLDHFFDGAQNTSRNIARIYLIQNHGLHYDQQLVKFIQEELIPNSHVPLIILWKAAEISSFALLLFIQGWGTALVAAIGLMLFGFMIPINYQSHLRRMAWNIQSLDSSSGLKLLLAGIHPERLANIVAEAIAEKRSPQLWWGIVRKEALDKQDRPSARDN
jgi:hypothetical protein